MNDLDFDDEAEADIDEHKDPTRYWGKYRGIVVDNADPEFRGRIIATVSSVQGLTPLTWAMPCVPLAGFQSGTFMVPSVGSKVWIEFEHGDPNLPIWVGCFWGSMAEVPWIANPPLTVQPIQNIVLQTTMGNSLSISDNPPKPVLEAMELRTPPQAGGIVLRTLNGAMLVVNSSGIFINNGLGASINLVGSVVSINKDAIVALK
jgi:hypothetical protein